VKWWSAEICDMWIKLSIESPSTVNHASRCMIHMKRIYRLEIMHHHTLKKIFDIQIDHITCPRENYILGNQTLNWQTYSKCVKISQVAVGAQTFLSHKYIPFVPPMNYVKPNRWCG
jgi:hypothetical protein